MYRIQNNKGFTLFEMIIVLIVITFISVVGLNVSREVSMTTQSDLYVKVLRQKLLYAQHYAVVRGIDTTVFIDSQNDAIHTSIPNDDVLYVPQFITTSTNTYQFSAFTGHLKVYSHYYFETPYYKYVLKVQFGRGQIYVEKIKK